MLSYLVTVHTTWTKVEIFKPHPNRLPDFVCMADGGRMEYFIVKDKNCESPTWRDRGRLQVHYHATNTANIVRWLPISRPKRNKKQDISEKQLELL